MFVPRKLDNRPSQERILQGTLRLSPNYNETLKILERISVAYFSYNVHAGQSIVLKKNGKSIVSEFGEDDPFTWADFEKLKRQKGLIPIAFVSPGVIDIFFVKWRR